MIKQWTDIKLKRERAKEQQRLHHFTAHKGLGYLAVSQSLADICDEIQRRAMARRDWAKWMPLILGPGMTRISLNSGGMPCMPKFGPIRPGPS